MISSAKFREQNQVLYSAKIVPTEIKTDVGVVRGDVIDLNHNDKADTEYQSRFLGLHARVVCKEPALSVPYAKIAEHAKAHETEVLTENDIDVKLKDLGATGTNFILGEAYNLVDENLRSPSTLVNDDVLPLEKNKDVKWGIDTATSEFVLFRPR